MTIKCFVTEAHFDEMVHIRRYLHQHPELSFHEEKTADYICHYYDKLGIDYQRHIGGHGIVATIKGTKPGKTIALRADFDALPIQDQKDVDYKSTVPGVMHACGHDGHTATLLVTAKILHQQKEHLSGKVVLIHQPAEEVAPGGAAAMIKDRALEGVDYVFGTHLWASLPVGTIQTTAGEFMAGADRFTIEINGVGGHGAMPHDTKDAIIIASALVGECQTIISRRIDPLDTAVLSIGKFQAGDAFNIIAGKATLEGTVRTFSPRIQQQIIKEMTAIIESFETRHGITIDFDYMKGYPPVVNHKDEAEYVINIAKETPGVSEASFTRPSMTGEDFSYYLLEKPGAFFFTGAKTDGIFYPHHHPKFDFNEEAMRIASNTFLSIITSFKN
ncbi:putative amidohydrolase YhaA [Halolactibacillus alkaliphilus]|uniref:Putative amidohydrolase YhaA n=1 Tax=Halolactibacillus alkaliphilus TaxID=442899 RepID=A0A511X357_9BACI|nr:amidohydrolase [Halolactibacillus alkaliphilus]GEN57389.1 putative amidohydrolase YhaA [Halolactibacillus alkaliphilus]GGN73254.1 putative amidohydrolase YhaA [Halolactibacillus alkaliphilus]SFO93827.1 amidohydrolase [Halolactibacillus alkaliphilus]